MILLALDMMTPTHQSFGLWKHPQAEVEQYRDLGFWVEHAQMLESAGFDALFFADVAGIYDVYGGDSRGAVVAGMQYPTLDPMLVVSALAHATYRMGITVTASVSYESPYLLARKFATLDHLSKGRIGWNIVTSYQRSAIENITGAPMLAHDKRYDRADEFMDVVYQLWETSIADDAVQANPATDTYLDPDKVRSISHVGEHFNVNAPATTLPGPQRTPFLFQAGSSPRGIDFALRHAEAIFISGTSAGNIAHLVQRIESRAQELGRSRESLRIICSLTVIAGESDDQAQRRYAEYQDLLDGQAALVLFSGWTGLDLSAYAPEDLLSDVVIEGNRSALQSFTSMDPDRDWTIADLAEFLALGARGAVLVGSGKTVADQLQAWMRQTGVDGFAIDYGIRGLDMRSFAEHVSPELRRRGLLKHSRHGTSRGSGTANPADKDSLSTLRARILGTSHLSSSHLGFSRD